MHMFINIYNVKKKSYVLETRKSCNQNLKSSLLFPSQMFQLFFMLIKPEHVFALQPRAVVDRQAAAFIPEPPLLQR